MSSKRVRLNRYGNSKSGRLLARALGIKMLSLSTGTGSRFRGKYRDVVINWGNGKGNVGNARQINKLQNVQLASNKLHTLEALQAAGISTPRFSTDKSSFGPLNILYGRSTLYGHSGQGIHLGISATLPNCPLYVQAIKKVAEYRGIVVGGKTVDFKKKKRKNDYEGEYGEHVWNHSSGYIFARNNFTVPYGASNLCVDAVRALGLDFGAVDIIEDEAGVMYVLEVNTACGLEGQTTDLFAEALKDLIKERYDVTI